MVILIGVVLALAVLALINNVAALAPIRPIPDHGCARRPRRHAGPGGVLSEKVAYRENRGTNTYHASSASKLLRPNFYRRPVGVHPGLTDRERRHDLFRLPPALFGPGRDGLHLHRPGRDAQRCSRVPRSRYTHLNFTGESLATLSLAADGSALTYS